MAGYVVCASHRSSETDGPVFDYKEETRQYMCVLAPPTRSLSLTHTHHKHKTAHRFNLILIFLVQLTKDRLSFNTRTLTATTVSGTLWW